MSNVAQRINISRSATSHVYPTNVIPTKTLKILFLTAILAVFLAATRASDYFNDYILSSGFGNIWGICFE